MLNIPARTATLTYDQHNTATHTPAGAPLIRSWFAADPALCISTIVGCCDFDTGLPPTQANARPVSHAFSDVTKPTKNPDLRTQPT